MISGTNAFLGPYETRNIPEAIFKLSDKIETITCEINSLKEKDPIKDKNSIGLKQHQKDMQALDSKLKNLLAEQSNFTNQVNSRLEALEGQSKQKNSLFPERNASPGYEGERPRNTLIPTDTLRMNVF